MRSPECASSSMRTSPRSAEYLRTLGHDAVHVREVGLKGRADQEIVAFARAEGRVLVTRDRDFADIRRYPPGSHGGTLRLKIPHPTAKAINAVLGRCYSASDRMNSRTTLSSPMDTDTALGGPQSE